MSKNKFRYYYHTKKIKKFIENEIFLITLSFLTIILFMSSGYSLLKQQLDIKGVLQIGTDKNDNDIPLVNREKLIENNKILINDHAILIVDQNEEEIKTFTITQNDDYLSIDQHAKQYIINISNETNNDYIGIKANLYLGKNNKLIAIAPATNILIEDDDVTFETPINLKIPKNDNIAIFVTINTDADFIPEIVMAGMK